MIGYLDIFMMAMAREKSDWNQTRSIANVWDARLQSGKQKQQQKYKKKK